MSAQETIKVRTLTYPEVAELKQGDNIIVEAHGRGPLLLVPAVLDAKINVDELEILRKGVPREYSIPCILVHTMYGSIYSVRTNKVYVEDLDGVETRIMKTVGTQVTFTLFLPGMRGEPAIEQVKDALRAEFGKGYVQLRKASYQAVPESGLPRTLDVPEGQVPEIL